MTGGHLKPLFALRPGGLQLALEQAHWLQLAQEPKLEGEPNLASVLRLELQHVLEQVQGLSSVCELKLRGSSGLVQGNRLKLKLAFGFEGSVPQQALQWLQ